MLAGMGKVRGGKKLDKLLKEAARRGPRGVRFGYLGGDLYPDGTPVAKVANLQEFGSPQKRIPERPFFRQALGAMRDDLRRQLRRGYDPRQGCVTSAVSDRLGETATGHIAASVDRLQRPPNAPATLEDKRGASPLVDTGQLRDAARHELLRRGGG